MENLSDLAALPPEMRSKIVRTLLTLDSKLLEAERKIRGRNTKGGNFEDVDKIADLKTAFGKVREVIFRGTQGNLNTDPIPDVRTVLSDVLSVLGHFENSRALEQHHKEAIEALRTALGLGEFTENPEFADLASRSSGATRASRSSGAGRRP